MCPRKKRRLEVLKQMKEAANDLAKQLKSAAKKNNKENPD